MEPLEKGERETKASSPLPGTLLVQTSRRDANRNLRTSDQKVAVDLGEIPLLLPGVCFPTSEEQKA